MVKLLIIADDFTGALDTGIQFAKRGICTQVFTKCRPEIYKIKRNTEVLVVDTESRPMSPAEAYKAVNSAASWGADQGIEIIFKKTDSALRGNIGAELQASADVYGDKTLYFLPAYPEIDRITKNGTEYIGGKLLRDSVFGKDPFEPAKKSYIPDIIKDQSDITVACLGNREPISRLKNNGRQVVVCDALNTEDIDRRLDELAQEGGLKLIAGCAALADCLVEKIAFQRTESKKFYKTDQIYVACGSLNKITQEQVEFAGENCEFSRRHLALEQKLKPAYYETPEGVSFLNEIFSLLGEEKKVIMDTFDMDENKEGYLKSNNILDENVRFLIAQAHGRIVKEIMDHGMDVTVLLTGGDTLMGYMKLIGCTQIEPVCEIEQGAVVSWIEWNGCRQQIISKSGGFGTKDILCKIARKILKQNI